MSRKAAAIICVPAEHELVVRVVCANGDDHAAKARFAFRSGGKLRGSDLLIDSMEFDFAPAETIGVPQDLEAS